jgi:uncharacterized protein YcbK (DUF882 family)
MSKWVYFQDSEVEGLKDEFIVKLDKARGIAGIPFIITSGFRSIQKNESVVGAVPDSSHTKGLAVDLRVRTSREAALIIDSAKEAGIDRRGIYVDSYWNPRHIHLDCDPDKIADVLFIKQEQN